jgi:general L-amino acid transport system substrate-binding protein
MMAACIAMGVGVLDVAIGRAGPTLDKVRSMGVVTCGVYEGLAGFSSTDPLGRFQGLAPDFCRAVAAAALGDSQKVKFVPLSSSSRLPVLLSGKIDLLAHSTTVTFGREAGIGVRFTGVYFHDGGTFLVPRASNIRKIEDLDRKTICVEKGTTHETNLGNVFQARGLSHEPLVIESLAGLAKALSAGECQAFVGDRSQLAAMRSLAPGGAEQWDILDAIISKEPLGPVVRRGDDDWFTLVRWVLFALIEAEERGVARENVRNMQKTSTDPGLLWFLNECGQVGKPLGLKPDWVAEVVAQVGNYGEIYDRHFGSQSPLKIERGPNRLWTQGGLLISPPFQ